MTSKLTPESERTSPNVFATLRSSMTGGSIGPGGWWSLGGSRAGVRGAAGSARPGCGSTQRISLAASGATASTLDASTKAPAVLMSRPEKPYFLVRQILRIGR